MENIYKESLFTKITFLRQLFPWSSLATSVNKSQYTTEMKEKEEDNDDFYY